MQDSFRRTEIGLAAQAFVGNSDDAIAPGVMIGLAIEMQEAGISGLKIRVRAFGREEGALCSTRYRPFLCCVVLWGWGR